MKAGLRLVLMVACAAGILRAADAPGPMPGTVTLLGRYQGTLHCPDCSGVRTELTLYREAAVGAPAAYALRETHTGPFGEAREVESVGRWRIVQGTPGDPDALVYQLGFDRPTPPRNFLRVSARSLRLLDGALAEASDPNTLTRKDDGGSSSTARATAVPLQPPGTGTVRGETPRSAILGYLLAARAGDDASAAGYLDLSEIPEGERAAAGPVLARHLKIVLDQTLWFGDLEEYSDDPRGNLDDGLPEDRERAGTIETSRGPAEVRLRRVEGSDGSLEWKLGPGTVARIPMLYDEFGIGMAGDYLPRWAYATRFGEIELWQWLAMPIFGLIAVAAAAGLTSLTFRFLIRSAQRTRTETDDRLVKASERPVLALLAIVLFFGARHLLHLSIPASRSVTGVLRVAVILAITWWVLQLVGAMVESARARLIAEGRHGALGVLILVRRVVRLGICVLAAIVILQQTHFRVTGLIAGLGLGGLAVGLGAQRSVANLLGGVTLAMDRTFRIGDLCRFGDFIGTPEEVGFLSTRIRTPDRTVVTLPNAKLADTRIENFALRDRIRVVATTGLSRETTPGQMRAVLARVRERLADHPRLAGERSVRFAGFGPGSLEVETTVLVATIDPAEALAVREEILLEVLEIVRASGAELALPAAPSTAREGAGRGDARSDS